MTNDTLPSNQILFDCHLYFPCYCFHSVRFAGATMQREISNFEANLRRWCCRSYAVIYSVQNRSSFGWGWPQPKKPSTSTNGTYVQKIKDLEKTIVWVPENLQMRLESQQGLVIAYWPKNWTCGTAKVFFFSFVDLTVEGKSTATTWQRQP